MKQSVTQKPARNEDLSVAVVALAVALVLVVLTTGCSSEPTTTSSGSTSTTAHQETSTTVTAEAVTTTTTTGPSGPPTVTHQQDNPRFVYSGKWRTVSANSASGDSVAVANSKGCSVTIRFVGTSASWIAKKSSVYGEAKVTVDGGAPETVDLYSAKTAWKKKVWQSGTLESGAHTVVIAWTGKKNTAAKDTNINVDAIVVTGVVAGLCQQSDPKIGYAGTWKTSSTPSASGKSLASTDSSGASVTVRFTGIGLVWMAGTGASYGQAEVTVDGGDAKTVDLYSSATKWRQRVFDTGTLELGNHTVKIEWLGTKNAASKGTRINVDAFDVTGYLR